jgi:hypothetical protein
MRKRDLKIGDYVRVKKINKKDHSHLLIDGRKIETFVGEMGRIKYIYNETDFQYEYGYDCSINFYGVSDNINFRCDELEKVEIEPFDWQLYDAHCNKVKRASEKNNEKLLDKMESKVHKFEQFEKVSIIKGERKGSVGEIADLHYNVIKNKWCFYVNTKNVDDGGIDMVMCDENQLRPVKENDFHQYLVEIYNYDESRPIQIVKSVDEARKIAESSVDDTFFGAEIYEIDSNGKIQKFQTYDRYYHPTENKWSDHE